MIINNLEDNVLNSYKVITVTKYLLWATHWLDKGNLIFLQIKFRIEHLKLEKLLRIYRVSITV